MIKLSDYNIKPNKLIRKGKIMIVDDEYVIKEKETNSEIYDYLISRNFNYFPKLLENREIEITEYQKDIVYPEEQKLYDLVDLSALLHSKTTYFEEIDEESIKKIYEDIDNNINYLYSYYNDQITIIESRIIYSPKEYLLARHISLIYYSLDIAKQEIDKLKEQVPEKTRKVVIHNNLDLDHYIRNDKQYLISWDKSRFDLPIFDIYKLLRRYPKYNPIDLLNRYEQSYPLLDYEKKILLILLSLPDIIDNNKSEFEQTRNIKKMLKKLNILSNYLKTIED